MRASLARGATAGKELDVLTMRAQCQSAPGVKDISVHQAPREGQKPTNAPIKGCLGAYRGVYLTLDARKRGHEDELVAASRGYHPHRGGHHDSGEDRSPSPDQPGLSVFGSCIRSAPFPPRYRPPMNIMKYAGETNPGLWLEDYQLSYRGGGTDSDDFIIRNLPLFLVE